MRKEFSELMTSGGSVGGSAFLKQEQGTVEDVRIVVVSESSSGGDDQTIADLVRSGVGAEDGEEEDLQHHHLLQSPHLTGAHSRALPYHAGLLRMSSVLGDTSVAVSGGQEVIAGGGVITLAAPSASTAVVVSTGHAPAGVISHHTHHSSNSPLSHISLVGGSATGHVPGATPSSAATTLVTYEHPLTAATTAMLNINGAPEDTSGFGVFYDIYGKMQNGGNITDAGTVVKSERSITTADIWS